LLCLNNIRNKYFVILFKNIQRCHNWNKIRVYPQ